MQSVNNMKTVKLFAFAALVALLSACNGRNVRIDGTLEGAEDGTVAVRLLDVNRYKTLDTVKVGKDGSYRYALRVEKGQPAFVYLFRGDTKIASLLLQAGDRVKVSSDTLGLDYTVSGSAESELLRQVEKDYAAFVTDMGDLARQAVSLDGDSAEAREARTAVNRRYIDYYRDRVKYILSNSKSLTVIPVLFQELDGSPVFARPTDALLFRSTADSLKAVYPASLYIKSLEKEAVRREQVMDMDQKIRDAGEASYLDIALPDMEGKTKRLSETEGKVVVLYFWTTADAVQKMFNIDQMLPVYEEFHPKGLEIYAVSLDADKTAWAASVRGQKLPWVNVCDTRGNASPYVTLYNLQSLPAVYFLVNGELTEDSSVTNAQTLRQFLAGKLK